MSQPIILKYTPNEQDYTQVLRHLIFRSTVNQILIGILALMFIYILYSIISSATPITIFTLVWVLLPPLFIIYTIFIQPVRMAKQYMKNERLAADQTWDVSDTGVKITSNLDTISYEWDALSKLVTSKDYYFLYLKKSKFAPRFLPRRSFTAAEDQDNFLQLMTSHLTQ